MPKEQAGCQVAASSASTVEQPLKKNYLNSKPLFFK